METPSFVSAAISQTCLKSSKITSFYTLKNRETNLENGYLQKKEVSLIFLVNFHLLTHVCLFNMTCFYRARLYEKGCEIGYGNLEKSKRMLDGHSFED